MVSSIGRLGAKLGDWWLRGRWVAKQLDVYFCRKVYGSAGRWAAK